jgi:hypothetical protein
MRMCWPRFWTSVRNRGPGQGLGILAEGGVCGETVFVFVKGEFGDGLGGEGSSMELLLDGARGRKGKLKVKGGGLCCPFLFVLIQSFL